MKQQIGLNNLYTSASNQIFEVREVTEFTYTFTTKHPLWSSIFTRNKKQVLVALELK
jgi:hypothetical protein